MRKALSLALGIHLLATGLVKAQTSDDLGDRHDGGQIVMGTGGILAVGGAGLAKLNVERMLKVYQRASVRTFETANIDGTRLNTNDIGRVANEVRAGDEIRITFRTSEIEERRLRISQLSQRKDEISREMERLRRQLRSIRNNAGATQIHSLSVQLRDHQYMLADIENQLLDMRRGVTPVDTRVVTRVVDMKQHTVRELEMFLIEKSRIGKNVLTIERIPRSARLEVAQMQRMMRGQIAVAVLGGAIILEELLGGFIGDGVDSMIDSAVYVPVMKEAANASADQK